MPPSRQFGTETTGNTRRGPNLTPDQRQQIIAKSAAGVATTELVREFGRSASAIKYTIKTYTNHATTVERPRSGRPPVLSRHQKRLLYRKARAAPKIEYSELAKVAQVVSPDDTTSKPPCKSTLYRALKEVGLTEPPPKIRSQTLLSSPKPKT